MNNRKIRVALTHGDTNGIGYELIFKTFAAPEMLELCTPVVYGSPKIAAYHRKALDIQANFSIINTADEVCDGRINLMTCFDDEVKVELGTPTEESGQAAVRALDRAMTDYREGVYDVLVAAPMSVGGIKFGNIAFDSLENYLHTCLGEGAQAATLYLNDFMHVAMVSDAQPVKAAVESITLESIVNKAALLYLTLKRDLRVDNPRIAVLGLNPKADGAEERDVIRPAVAKLSEAGMCAFGPYAADTFFGSNDYDAFDGILAMYHDQAMLPFRTLSVEEGVSTVANLPIVCTKTNYTPMFEVAGQGVVDENPFRQAVYLAIDIHRNRLSYDEPLKNPLPKLYHERREEHDKSRFNVPKRHVRVGQQDGKPVSDEK